MKKLVDEYNMQMKRKMLGKVLEVYLLESGGKIYGYPVKHGPVVFIVEKPTHQSDLNGRRALVKVTDVKPRYVFGVIDRILEA